MIKSILVDEWHLVSALTESDNFRAILLLQRLTLWIEIRGILCVSKKWTSSLAEFTSKDLPGDDELNIAIDEFLSVEPRINLDQFNIKNIHIDYLVGDIQVEDGCTVGKRLSLMDCDKEDLKIRRDDSIGLYTIAEGKIDHFEDLFKRMTWFSRTFVLYDSYWGKTAIIPPDADEEKKESIRQTRGRFAHGIAYIIKLICESTIWPKDTLKIVIITPYINSGSKRFAGSNISEDDPIKIGLFDKLGNAVNQNENKIKRLRYGIELIQNAKNRGEATAEDIINLNRKNVELENACDLQDKLQYVTETSDRIRLVSRDHKQYPELHRYQHDRYFYTEHHEYSFGRGFDLFLGSKLRETNIYWAKPKIYEGLT